MPAKRIRWHGQDLPAVREVVKIGEVETVVDVPDVAPELRHVIAALSAIGRFEGAGKIAPVHLLETTACLFIRHGGTVESWRAYETSLGVPRSKSKQPRSPLQPFLRYANGGKPDTTGWLYELSGALDDWVELGDQRPDPTPKNGPGTSAFARWLAEHGGYTTVAALHRGRVWVINAYHDEQVFSSKEGATRFLRRCYEERGIVIPDPLPVYEEPAENFSLTDCEPDTDDEWRHPDDHPDYIDDPIPRRVKGRWHPPAIGDGDASYSETENEGTPAERDSQDHSAQTERDSASKSRDPRRETRRVEPYSESKNEIVETRDRQEAKAPTATETRHRGSGDTKTRHQQLVFEPQGLAELIGKVNHGDCLEIMRLIPERSIKGIITSPPYNIRVSTGGGLRNGTRKMAQRATIERLQRTR
jgi:hypothetical protein